MRSTVILLSFSVTLLSILMYTNAWALTQSNENTTTIIPINEKISLEKVVTTMEIPDEVNLSWGFVKGKPVNYAERYPVIIQFFKGEQPVHVAQVKVKGDGSFEYKFKIRDTHKETGIVTNLFEGEYTVKIFRAINN